MKQRSPFFKVLRITLIFSLLFSAAINSASAQNKIKTTWYEVKDWCLDHQVADRLDVGVSLSSMGLGIDVETRATKWVNVRAGVDWMPRFSLPMSFNLNTFSNDMPTGNFNKVAEMLFDATGIEMDETVHMKGKGSMVNFKLLVDVFPFQNNRHWHVTAGFYAGTSMIASAVNTYDEKPTLVGLNIYNRAYQYFTTLEDIFNVPIGGGAFMDPEEVERLQERFNEYGRMGIHIGNFKDGTPYIMEPAPDGTISAKAYVNHFKPYLGIGYSTDLDHAKRWHFSVDIGALFWGHSPKVINHDYTTGKDINFTKDLVNIRGKVGDYINVVKALPVYPMLAVRFSYSIL